MRSLITTSLFTMVAVAVASAALAQNPNGIWVPDVGTGTVTLLNLDGTVRSVYPVGGAPRGAAIDRNGNAYIARLTERGIAKIAADGSGVQYFSAGITSKTVAIDRDDNIWITNQSIDTVTKIDSAGNVLGEFPVGDGPRVLAVDANNDIWLTCKFSNEVLKLDTQGNIYFRTQVGLGPRGVAIDSTGTAWIANLSSSTVSKVSSAGVLLGDFPVPNAPAGIAIDRRGNVWVASGLADAVTVLAPDGSTLLTIPTLAYGASGPLNTAPDGDGNMWIICKLSSIALKFNLNGALQARVPLNTLSRPEPFGDLTGFLRAKFADPTGDDDLDGLANGLEIQSGFNPFSRRDPLARAGNVNDVSGTPEEVLKINGSTGGPARRVPLAVGEPVGIRVKVPTSGPYPAQFSLYVYVGEIDSTSITNQPFGLGVSAIPTPLNGPNPRVVTLFNTLGYRRSLGVPRFPGQAAPALLGTSLGVQRALTATLQGFILDASATSRSGLSITNAITIEVH